MKTQLAALCTCYAMIYCGFSALIGLMPIYLPRLGANPTVTGFFLAITYVFLALGTIFGGWLSEHWQRRKLPLLVSSIVAIPLTWWMSQTENVWVLLCLTVCLRFVTGIAMTMVNIILGLLSEGDNRGRNFGLLTVSAGLGSFLGGFINGRVVDYGGFPALFRFFSLFYLLVPLVALFIKDHQVERSANVAGSPVSATFTNRTFTWLFIACVLAQSANIVLFLTRPVLMEQYHFDATAIGMANAVGSLITLPVPLLMGWLADRINRKYLLAFCFLAPALGLLALIWANGLWSFWLSSILSTVVGVSTVVGSAQVMDTFPKGLLSTPLALLNATPWIGIVIGLSAGGLAISAFEIVPTLCIALVPSFVAIFLLTRIQENLAPVPITTD